MSLSQSVRIYTRPSEIFSCLNCPSNAMIKGIPIPPLRLRCMEYPDEIKEIDIKQVLGLDTDKPELFPDFCPLKKTTRRTFEKNRVGDGAYEQCICTP